MSSTVIIAGLVAFVTIIGTMYNHIIPFVSRIVNIIVGVVDLDKELGAAVFKYCYDNFKPIPIKMLSLSSLYSSDTKNNKKLIACDIIKDNVIIFRSGWRFVVIVPGQFRYDPATCNWERGIRAYFPRIMWNPETILKTILDQFNQGLSNTEIKHKRFHVQKVFGASKNLIIQKNNSPKDMSDLKSLASGTMLEEIIKGRAKPLNIDSKELIDQYNIQNYECLIFPKDAQKCVQDTEFWFKSKDWYHNRGIAWKRGVLFHGRPGTGKTMLLKTLAKKLDLPVYLFDLASLTNQEFSREYSNAISNAPCMILMEDIDTVFNRRENITKIENGLSFDCLLNCISGIEDSDGILLGITTNDITKVDDAIGKIDENGISSRPGRIDAVVELGVLDHESKLSLAKKIMGENKETIEHLIQNSKDMTIAQFSYFCSKIALNQHWNKE